MTNHINCKNTGGLLVYRDLVKMDASVWSNSMCNELGRLSQGEGKNAGADTIEFIFHKDKPKYRRAAYVRAVCNIRPQKKDNRRTRLTAGGNIIDYSGEVSTPTSDLTTTKLHVNSAISDVKLRYMCIDVKYFHLNNQMGRSEYIVIQISIIPQEFVDKYNLKGKVHNGYIFTLVTKGMYVLPQAGRIVHDAIAKRLETYGYRPSRKPLRLWTHNSLPINFTLVVDDF